MNYAIEILEKEKHILENCLKSWDPEIYREAYALRNKRLKDIEIFIESANDLKKLAEIERDFSIFGTLTFEQQKEKTEILKKYE